MHKQIPCRSEIVAIQLNQKKKEAYLNLLLRPGRVIVKKTTAGAAALSKAITQSNAVRSATEGVLSAAVVGMDLIAQGLAMINVTEVRGEYTWDDMKTFKLPKLVRLVARLNLPQEIMPPMELVLQDLQFDFEHPATSAASIAQSILMSVVQAQENKYIGYAMAFAE